MHIFGECIFDESELYMFITSHLNFLYIIIHMNTGSSECKYDLCSLIVKEL